MTTKQKTKRRTPDALAGAYTACVTLAALCDLAEASGYTPTIAPVYHAGARRAEVRRLADEFDAEMARRGSDIRAWRGANAAARS